MSNTTSIQDKFNFPVSFQTEIVSYLFSDTNMFGKMAGHIKPAFFTEYQLREIMTIALEFFVKYEEVPHLFLHFLYSTK